MLWEREGQKESVEVFFVQRMDLHLDGESVEFIYRSANLNDHDASLQFEMKSYAQQASSLELELLNTSCLLAILSILLWVSGDSVRSRLARPTAHASGLPV